VKWENVPFSGITYEEAKKYLLNEGDLIFARTGATV
jgi:type I restriction enzyme S subunit